MSRIFKKPKLTIWSLCVTAAELLSSVVGAQDPIKPENLGTGKVFGVKWRVCLLRLFALAAFLWAGTSSAWAQTTYWIPNFEASLTERTYRFGIQLPDTLGKQLASKGTIVTHTVDGKPRQFIQVAVDWDNNTQSKPSGYGVMSIHSNKGYGQDWLPATPEIAKNAELMKAFDSMAVRQPQPIDGWSVAELMILSKEGAENPNLTLRIPRPERDQIKARMVKIAENTVPGRFFPGEVQIPADLDAMRREMLAVGNIGRRDPNFRKANKYANNLQGETTTTNTGTEKIYKDNLNPPYFNDLVLHPKLNEAAQYMAEYYATTNGNASMPAGREHDAPGAVWSGAKMDTLGDRLKHFSPSVGSGGEGLAGPGEADSAPENWMHTETHYRPWFNIGTDTKSMGLGAARTAKGWFFCKIGGTDLPDGTARAGLNAVVLAPGQAINVKEKYWSVNKEFYAIFQSDGNFGVSTKTDGYKWDIVTMKKTPLWAKKLVLERTGNLVFLDQNNKIIWSIEQLVKPVANSTLQLSNTGALLLLGPDGAVVWDSRK